MALVAEDPFQRSVMYFLRKSAGFTLANLGTSLKVSTVIISFDKCESARRC